MSKTISTIDELDAIILSLIKIPAYNRMLSGIDSEQKETLLKNCIDNNVKDSVDFVLMCEG